MDKCKSGYELINGKCKKSCSKDQKRDSKTLRCRSIKRKSPTKKSHISCKEGYELINGTCRKDCRSDQYRDLVTLNCRKITKAPRKKAPKKSPKRKSLSPKRKSPTPKRKSPSPKKVKSPLKCKPGYEMINDKCKKICKDNQIRDIKTLKCKKIKTSKKKSPKKQKSKSSSGKASEMDDEYLNLFLDVVDELPFITYKDDIEAGDEPYTKMMFIEDIINIIHDLFKQTGHIVVPDAETMLEIANIKFDNGNKKHTKDVNEFIYGTNRGNDGVFDKIRTLTRTLERKKEQELEEKYKNIGSDDEVFVF